MKFKVTDRQIVRVDKTTCVTNGSVGIDEAVFEFSVDWDGLDKSAVFESNGVAVTCRLKAGDPAVRIPPEVLATPLESLRIGVFGLRGTEIVKPTTWCTAISVILPGVPTNAPGSVPPTPSVYQQWVSDIRADATQVAADAARVDTDKKAVAADRQAVDQLASGFGDTVRAAGTAVVQAGGQQVLTVQNQGTQVIAAVDAKKTIADQSAADARQAALDADKAKTQAQATQAAIGANGINMFASPIWQKVTGASVSVTPAVGSNWEVKLNGATTQPGTGDPSPTNIRAISGVGQYDKKIALNRTEGWKQNASSGDYLSFYLNKYSDMDAYRQKYFSNFAAMADWDDIVRSDGEFLWVATVSFGVRINKKRLETYDVSGFKKFLKNCENSGNHLTVYYQSTSYATATQVYCGLSIADANGNYHGYAAGLMAPLYEGDILDFVSGKVLRKKGYLGSYIGETLPSTWLSDRNVYAAGTIPTIGAQVVYELAVPTTETVPISEPIPLPPAQADKYNPQPVAIASADGTTVTVSYNMDGTAAYNTLKAALAALGGI